MVSSFSGGCLCGSVRYRCDGAPLGSLACHCTACQKRTSGPFGTVVLVPAETLVVEKGAPKTYLRTADSGNEVEIHFCGDCGTSLYAVNSGRPHASVVFAGSLDDPSWVEIQAHAWTDSALPWVKLDGAKCFPKAPEMAKPPAAGPD